MERVGERERWREWEREREGGGETGRYGDSERERQRRKEEQRWRGMEREREREGFREKDERRVVKRTGPSTFLYGTLRLVISLVNFLFRLCHSLPFTQVFPSHSFSVLFFLSPSISAKVIDLVCRAVCGLLNFPP